MVSTLFVDVWLNIFCLFNYMSHMALTATQRKKLEKYLYGMSKRAAYTLAISSLVLSELDRHKAQETQKKKKCLKKNSQGGKK